MDMTVSFDVWGMRDWIDIDIEYPVAATAIALNFKHLIS